MLEAPLAELYDVREVDVDPPRPARILASIDCLACGEPTMETRIRRLDGRELCLPCFQDEMAGDVRLPSP